MTLGSRPLSIRTRLTRWYAGALTLALLAYALLVFAFLWRVMSSDLNRELNEDLALTQQMVTAHNGQVIWGDGDADDKYDMPRTAVFDQEGKMIYRGRGYRPFKGEEYRTASRAAFIPGLVAPEVTIRAMRPVKPMYRELGLLALVLVLGIPLTVALAAAGGYALAQRALAPVDRMTSRARAITAERLSDRLPVDNPDDELGRLAIVFNETFGRLQHSFSNLRSFTADASHELRTPLAAIRSVGEVGLNSSREPAQYREIIGSMLEEVDRLARLVDTLLTLSRADSGQVRLQSETFDLCGMARDVAQQLGVLAEEKKQSLDIEAPPELRIAGDPMVLRQALTNLIDNAIKYSPDLAVIRIVVREAAGRAIMEVIDSGPGIAPEHLSRIFERFYRIDKARSRSMGGTGLGLAICRWAVEAHGGMIEVESRVNLGSIFRISIPEPKPENRPENRIDNRGDHRIDNRTEYRPDHRPEQRVDPQKT